jgi:hypothetical protein
MLEGWTERLKFAIVESILWLTGGILELKYLGIYFTLIMLTYA